MTRAQPALDPREIRRSFDEAAARYDTHAVLQAEVRQRLLERLDFTRLEPAVVVDLGCGTGGALEALQERYPAAQVLALDIAEGMLRRARERSIGQCIAGDVQRLPLADASVDLVFSSLTLQWCTDLGAALAECRRVLRPGGLLNFTTLGPQTLGELRAAWAAVDDGVHVNDFVELHELGDGLVGAGLAEPVLDIEHLTLTYREVGGLMRDLKAIGARNASVHRSRGLTGRGRHRRLAEAYEGFRREGVLPATYEVIFAQAWGPTGQVERGRRSGEFAVPVTELTRRAGALE